MGLFCMDRRDGTRATSLGLGVFTRSAGGVVGCRGVDEEAIGKRRVSQKRGWIYFSIY
jgi:hypothetical protein